MKTLMLWREFPDENVLPKFLELEGDFSRFNGIYINEYNLSKEVQKLQSELCDVIYGKDGNKQIGWLIAPTKDFDSFIYCGIYI